MKDPQSARHGRRIYLVMASLSGFSAVGWGVLHGYLPAAGCAVMAAASLCGYADCSGYQGGYRDGLQDGEEREFDRIAVQMLEAEQHEEGMLRPCDLDLTDWPVHPDPEVGYLYVIKFSSGAVKVGQTRDPARRFAEHRRDSSAYKVWIVDFWVSAAHRGYLDNEVDLIGLCMNHGARAKREYFHDIDFGDACRYAEGLPVSATQGGTE